MTTVADIVLAKPAAARVFERHEIDYCCHGQRPLEQACSEAGVDLDAVQAELDALAVAPLTGPVADEVGASSATSCRCITPTCAVSSRDWAS